MDFPKTRITIFGLYVLSNHEIKQVKEVFYNKFQKLVDDIEDGEKIIVIRDFNRRTGFRKDNIVVLNFRKQQLNNSEKKLINFCHSNEPKITNGFF